MHQTVQLVDALKKFLRAKGITYREVAGALDLSEASVKRIFASRSFSLQRLEQVCRHVGLSIYELARLAAHEDRLPVTTLNIDQEAALADDPELFSYFYLLINGWSPAQVKRRLSLDETQSVRYLTRLHRLELIELYSRNRVRTLTARTIAWRKDGPVRRRYEAQVREEFLSADFEASGGIMRFETAELDESSLRILMRKIDKLVKEFNDLVELDTAVTQDRKQSVGLLLAARPWVFSLLADARSDRGFSSHPSDARQH